MRPTIQILLANRSKLLRVMVILPLASCGGCTERTPNVCCTSDIECAQLGLPPGSASDYGCAPGHACRDFYCVPDEGPDASTLDSPADAPAGRCSPSAPFGTPTRLASLSTQFEDLNIAVSYDELKAYVGRFTANSFNIATSERSSRESDFPAPTTSSDLTAIEAGPGDELYLYPTSDDLVVYYRDGSYWSASYRLSPNEPFNVGSKVYVDGVQLFGHRAIISADTLTLYWAGPGAPLHAASHGGTNNIFVYQRVATTFELTDFAISSDQLTLYYSNYPYPDIFISTRESRDVPFDVGVPVANVNTTDSDVPMGVSADGCLLYIRSDRLGSDGRNDFWVARRGQ